MQDLTYLKKPESGDTGSTLFEALEDDIEILDGHNHDGETSEKLTSQSITAKTGTITTDSWETYNNIYKKTVSMPAGMKYSEYVVIFKDGQGNQIHCGVDAAASDEQYVVYHINNTTELTAYYLA